MNSEHDNKIIGNSEVVNTRSELADLPLSGRAGDGIVRNSVKTINLSGDQIVVTDELPGVYCKGVQYYDLKNIDFINYAGMASLIDFLKTLLEKGIDVKFVNVNEKIKNKIKSIGLDHILNCV
jgi:ABC-type transporter Mla MlaB component